MSSFTKPLRVEITQHKVEGRTLAVLLEDFDYHVGSEESNDVITVTAGFMTDFASVPRLFWRLFPPLGRYAKASVVHDWGYVVQDRTRAEYDWIFFEAMGVLGVALWQRLILYVAVRLFAGSYWERCGEIKSDYESRGAAIPGSPDATLYGRRAF